MSTIDLQLRYQVSHKEPFITERVVINRITKFFSYLVKNVLKYDDAEIMTCYDNVTYSFIVLIKFRNTTKLTIKNVRSLTIYEYLDIDEYGTLHLFSTNIENDGNISE